MASSSDAWSNTPWKRNADLALPMWHKSQIPYSPLPNSLQHVDVWIPVKYAPDSEQLAASWLPPPNTLWIIYVHGGAWRDPVVTSTSLTPTLQNLSPALLESRSAPVAFASISYSLSPYPRHGTHPSSPSDVSRNASHPQHIADVLAALSLLQGTVGFDSRYILTGHSCGATLAFQAAMNPAKWDIDTDVCPPAMVVGLNGLYSLPGIIEDAGPKHSQYSSIYEEFTRGAFGDDKDAWTAVSPVSVENWADEWPDGRYAMLVQSHDDGLVPFSQAEMMKESLQKSKSDMLRVELIEGHGDHEDIWEKGTLFAQVLKRAVDVFDKI